MAKSVNNIVTHGLSGKVGNLLVFSQRKGKTIVSMAPKKSNKATDKQLELRTKFQEAVIYSKAARQDPNLKPQYETDAKEQGLTAHNIAVADFLKAPKIESIDRHTCTGAAQKRFCVNAPPTLAPSSSSSTVTSLRPALRMPACTTPIRSPAMGSS